MSQPELQKLKQTQNGREEDWEVVSGANSLTEVPEHKASTKNVEDEDWYKKIPATPANTPEHNPIPPAYPGGRKLEGKDNTDLPAIKESDIEGQDAHPDSDGFLQEYTPVNSEDELELQENVEKSIVIFVQCFFGSVALYFAVQLIKWSINTFSNVFEKLNEKLVSNSNAL